MIFNSLIPFLEVILLLMIGFSLIKYFFKSRKRSAESIYKLIEDLEKKYIH